MLAMTTSECSVFIAMLTPSEIINNAIPCTGSSRIFCGILLRSRSPARLPHIISKAFAKLPKSGIEVRKSKEKSPFARDAE